jgi:pilus assembly protein CpaE
MTALSNNESGRTWQASQRENPVQLFLAEAQGDAPAVGGMKLAGFGFALNLLPVDSPLDASEIAGAPAAVVQVHSDLPESLERFRQLARGGVPLIAAMYEPPLKVVRELILAGAHDVLPLPLDAADLERSLGPIREAIEARPDDAQATLGKTVVMLKAVGGVGATSLLSQTAIDYARRAGAHGAEACLIDLDIQFGDAAFQLGMRPSLTIQDLIEAGSRVDGDMLRAATATHASGLRVLAAPSELLPLDAFTNDAVISLIALAQKEFGTVFIDLPSNWTNWSLSLVARADIVLLVTEMSVSCLHRARRQLDLLRSQDMAGLDVRIVVNRVEKGLLRSVKLNDVEKSLGREVGFTIANDHPLMRSAIDRGVPLWEVKPKSALGKDIEALSANLASLLGSGA